MAEAFRSPQEVRTTAFFDRPVDIVASELGGKVFKKVGDQVKLLDGHAKLLQVMTFEGEQTYRITIVQPYHEENAILLWKGKRARKIRLLPPGGTVTFRSRNGELTFVHTEGADNIEILELEDIETGKRTKNPTEVSGILGVTHGEEGQLSVVDKDTLIFSKA